MMQTTRMRSMTCSPILKGKSIRQPAFFAGCLFFVVALTCMTAASAAEPGEYWQPQNPDEVIVTLPDAGATSAAMNRLRHRLLIDPRNATLATHYATAALKQYATSGDPRLLGYAAGVLQPWSADSSPPSAIWLLRGRLKQTQHQFSAAADDMEQFLRQSPGEPQALTLAADARRRAGDLVTARKHCLSLQLAGHSLLARLCAADVSLSLGDFNKGLQLAQQAAGQAGAETPPESRIWAWSIAGDAAFAQQRFTVAEDAYNKALQLTNSPTLALRLAIADLYIEMQRFAEAWELLDELPPADAVMLRQAMVATRYKPDALPAIRSDLKQSFRSAGNDDLHWREQAMFALHVENNPSQAQVFARRNWEVQKGWEDAALLQQTSAVSKDNDAIQILQEWRQSQRSAAL